MRERERTLILLLALWLFSGQTVKAADDTYIDPAYVLLCEEVGAEYSIQPEFLESFIEAESSGDPRADNGSCKGLMQVYESVHKGRMRQMGITDIYDPRSNIRLGASILVDLFERYGDDTAKIVMMYNGSSDAKARAEKGDFTEYAQKVMRRAMELEEIHGKHDYSSYLKRLRADERKRNKMEGL